MSTELEQLLRRSLERQADRAVHPDRVRAGLADRTARHSRRRHQGALVMAAAVVTVAAAVTVPVLATDSGPAGPAAGSQPPALSPPASADVGVRSPLSYDLTWVPEGMAERHRYRWVKRPGGEVGDTLRTWTADPVGSAFDIGGTRVELQVMSPDMLGDDGAEVDINGKSGRYIGTSGKSYVRWRVDADTVLLVSEHGGLPKAELLKVARGVRPVTAELVVPLRPGWLPNGVEVTGAYVSGDSPTSWRFTITAGRETPTKPVAGDVAKQKADRPASVGVTLSNTTDAPAGGEAVTVQGRPGRYLSGPVLDAEITRSLVVVELGDGRILTVSISGVGDWTRADIVKLADKVEVGPQPDLSWLGTP